jgi:hypothetical protein
MNRVSSSQLWLEMMAQLVALESAVCPTQPPPANEPAFTHIPGTLPILISAPHSTAHWRNGRLKKEEGFTAAISHYIAMKTGAHALYTHYQSEKDPNWHKTAPYKSALARILSRQRIKFVLDLHGMSNRHNIGLALGTINGRSCPQHEQNIIQTLQAHGFHQTSATHARELEHLQWRQFIVNHPRFTGGVTSHTVTRFVSQEVGIPAAQLELCTLLRVVPPHYQRYEDLLGGVETAVSALIALVQNLSQR